MVVSRPAVEVRKTTRPIPSINSTGKRASTMVRSVTLSVLGFGNSSKLNASCCGTAVTRPSVTSGFQWALA
jgi:hypothetical protein